METPSGTVVTLKLKSSDTVKSMKEQIQVSPDEHLCMFKGKILKDNHTLSECGIQSGSKLKLVPVPVYLKLLSRH